ncbi:MULTISPECIES: DUF134 domain-containing protein [Psychrilyobacter]|uniref:DUF134 domain-containing protein n=1 Tax=Psychrilyobacter piezotolerans TaxID=2293438 RepID=A0ABX9KIH3_9FUSO|nr:MULTISPECIES: DUF134 domain-containing protein [Psychrilyobacter]MCS5421338.1 DUF134 domain-containing protein [Psychrilyobacter sp. S5]NDI77522.1 DUF134 domain-containing protein [Psychrilyobacter piezotolerans]RDE62965.1 DUF134 domain-containing protein [Psychrilyobacter sp. S5]REI41723.1 DUF134 domain-containing protein [Psychrilyobacter piezotolerans]
MNRKKKRCCRFLENEIVYKPVGISMKEIDLNNIEADEFEAIRICDYEGKSQIEASELMGISRGTIQRLLNSGRKKIVDSFLNEKAIVIKNKH